MSVDQSTQQFMYRVFIGVMAGAIAATMLYTFAVGWKIGDGEAIKIAEAFAPFLTAALFGMLGMFGIHTAGQTIQAKYQAQQPTPAPVSSAIPAAVSSAIPSDATLAAVAVAAATGL